MNTKQNEFIKAYSDPSSESYGNATKSAIKAGYSAKRARSQGCVLLKLPEVSQQIATIEKNHAKKHEATLENKIQEAWENYLEAKAKNKMKDARAWFEEHGKLAGHYVIRSESREEVVHKEEVQAEIAEYIRSMEAGELPN